MKSSTLLLLSANIVAFATAATIAPNLPDGFYHAWTDENGIEFHTQISSATNDNVPMLSWTHDPSNTTLPMPANPFSRPQDDPWEIEKRCSMAPIDDGEVWCGCTHTLNPSNCDAAVQDLKNQVGSQPGGSIHPKLGNAWYSIRGSVVAFQCPYSGWTSTLNVPDISNYLAIITATCGRYISGTVIGIDPNREVSNSGVGYMQAYPGLDFCSAQFNSGSHCC
jgi:hypothetical protein